MTEHNNRHWYAVHTKPRQEKQAAEHLARQAFNVYLPKIKTRRRRQNQWKDIIEPLFPRYLFIHMDLKTDNPAPIRSTRGVSGLISFNNKLAILPDNVINQLKQSEDNDALHPDNTPLFATGTRVGVVEGPFKGLEAGFKAETGEERAIILMNMLGKHQQLTVSLHSLQPLN